MNKPTVTPLVDDDIFPFGKHREQGTRMKDVPASYLDWFDGQEWAHRWPGVVAYIEANRKYIDKELERQGKI